MMNQEEYPSDSDVSDEDFQPGNEESNSGSELESEEDDVPKSNGGTNGSKRKRKGSSVGTKRSRNSNYLTQESDDETDEELAEQEEKRKTDALWASFLGGETNREEIASSTKSTSSASNSRTKEESKKPTLKVSAVPTSTPAEKKKPTVAQLFEFAGEQIILQEEECSGADSVKDVVSNTHEASKGLPRRGGVVATGGGGGLGAVLNQINKKNKLTTLEKTKLDWTSFKRQEGIAEELQTHNKGKDGFLERRDFLDRTDVRQFEIEKSFRQTKRSNR